MASQTKATSIHQVAKHAGVSAGTVSRVINADPRISRPTVELVRKSMASLGYEPRPRAQRPGPRPHKARQSSVRQIALLSSHIQGALNSPVYTAVIDGVEEGAVEAGVNLVFRKVREVNRLPSDISGAIVFGSLDPRSVPSQLPCVRVMGQRTPDPRHDWVTYDDSAVGQLAFEYLAARGCTRAAVVADSGGIAMVQRTAAFKTLCAAHNVHVTVFERPFMVRVQDRQFVSSDEMRPLGPLLKKMTPRPAGLFLGSDAFAPAAYAILHQHGLKPGSDVIAVSVNNDRASLDHLVPSPPSVDIHPASVGRRAVEQLIWRIAHPGEPRMELKLMPTLETDA